MILFATGPAAFDDSPSRIQVKILVRSPGFTVLSALSKARIASSVLGNMLFAPHGIS
jgi:hypothetical protein